MSQKQTPTPIATPVPHSLLDDFKKAISCPVSLLGNALVHVLEVRIPTAHKTISDKIKARLLDTVRPGDILLTTDPAYLLWETFEFALAGSHFTHAMFYEGDGNVLEATIEGAEAGVLRSVFANHLVGAIRVAVIRPPYQPGDVQSVLDYARAKLGKPYDDIFDIEQEGGEKYYCSSLVYAALQQLPTPIDVPTMHRFNRTLVLPDHMLHIENANIVYADKFNIWSNATGAAPTAVGAVASAAALHLVMPHLAIVSGFYLAVSAGNKLQTGHFGLTGG